MNLTPGTKLGPYEVLSPLGAGGMGEVYRARDTRLGRDVAVKVLPQHLSSNSEVRARFEREAKTVSSLNHPYICTLHDIGREGDTDYLVMELVDGETLASRIARGVLPPSDVLKIGAQIADALDRAHRAGVVHRDLKPGNIMLTKSGAKLMDFGLARATGLGAPGSTGGMAMTQSPTIAQPLTAEGTIVGTFQYMSPEQLEGKETDARSDIWALGCVLYEMTTGKRAFDGSTQASLISAIMRDQPRAMSELSPLSPPALERLVRQCLAKDPDERWQTAGDVRRELEWIAGSSSQSAAPAVARPSRLRRNAPGWIAAGVILVAALGYTLGPGRVRTSAKPLVRFMIEAPTGMRLEHPAEAALSPDGSAIAFVASDSSGIPQVCVRALANPVSRAIPGTLRATLPFWSPDGRMIGFFANDKLYKVGLDGSAPVALCDATDPRGGAWSKDGVILLAPGNQGPIARVSENGGSPEAVTTLDVSRGERGHRYPQFLPDDGHFLYVAIGANEQVSTFAASLEGGAPVEVCKAGSRGVWAEPGYLLYLDAGVNSGRRRLLARRFNPSKLKTDGEASLVIDPVNATNFGYANTTASDNGTMVVQHWSNPRARLEWHDRRGAVTGVVDEGAPWISAAISPDGTQLAYASLDPQDVFVRDLQTGISTRLTFENHDISTLVWSPDGRRIAFSRLFTDRGWQTFTKNADGTGPDSLLFRGPSLFNQPAAWSPDGRWVVALCTDANGNFDIWRIPADGSGAPEVYQRTPGRELNASISPDGNWIAYATAEGDKSALYVQSFPNPGAKYEIGLSNAMGAVWSARGDELLAGTTDNVLYSVAVTTRPGFRQGARTRLMQIQPDQIWVDYDRINGRLLLGRFKDLSSLSRLEVVFNWPVLLGGSK